MSLGGTFHAISVPAGASPARGAPGVPSLGNGASGLKHLRIDAGIVRWREQPIDLTGTEFKMLVLLIRAPGSIVSYRNLYDLVHGPGFMAGKGIVGYRANVRAFIKRIRRKFRDIDDGFDAIGNDPGAGYFWRE